MNPLKVGIIGLKCHDHLSGAEVPRYLGGIETQLATLAKGLVAEGCDVAVITFDHGEPGDRMFDGVQVIKSHAPKAGIPIMRTIHPRTTGLWTAMRRAGADVYLQMGAGIETGQSALICRVLGRPFVYCMASDPDAGEFFSAGLEGRAYLSGLRRAKRIIAQSSKQQEGLKSSAGLNSKIIPMAVVPPIGRAPCGSALHVLWVGRITPSKRLEWLIETARRYPNVIFDIVGTPNRQSEHANQLMKEARGLSNVEVHGRAPATALADLYAGASLLACTSELEGFPTTFLEAWSVGLPVLTTFDPDGVVTKNKLGLVADDLEDFVSKLGEILQEETARELLAANARKYFEDNHSVAEVCRRFREMLEEACQG